MAGLDPKIVDTLLDKLSSDEEFRVRFQNSAPAALGELGHTDREGGEATCLQTTQLASKEVIRQSLDELRAQLTSNLMQLPHKLEA
jgi:putative modified peptide